MGLLYALRVRIMNFMVFFLIIILLPGLPPRTTFPFKEFIVSPTKALKGALEPNFHLDGAERLLVGRVYGPECLISHKNEIYTGIHGGEVIKLSGSHVTHVTKIGQPCEDIIEESRCGRPLGLAFDNSGKKLIISDAYYGLWEVELATNKKKLLVSPEDELPGKDVARRAKIFNSIAIDKRGDIYFTDSSSDFSLQDLVFSSFANPSGRLFKYDPVRNSTKLLLDELFFANGVVISPDEDFVVVAETGSMRLLRYYVKGSKAGQSDIFVEGLPGLPDNLTPDAEGIWVPLIVAADKDHPSAFSIFSRFPSLRVFFARMLALFELPFRYLNSVYPNRIAQRFIHFIGHFESISFLSPKRSTIVRVDWNGNIVGSLHGFDKSVGAVSHVLEFNEYLYLGSPLNRFLARVKSPKASKQPGVKIRNVRFEGANMEPVVKPPVAKPTTTTTTTTTTKKPTTTATPRPTTTTTTPRPTTTSSTTTTTPKPATTTTVKPPIPSTSAKSAPKVITTTSKPATTTARAPPKEPAPVDEQIAKDTKPPKLEKLKVINKHGEHVEF